MAPGSTVTARLNVGEDLAQAGPVNLKLRLQFQTAVDPQLVQVFCNNQPLSLLGTNLTWVEYSVSPPVINQLTNQVKVTLAPNATHAVWMDDTNLFIHEFAPTPAQRIRIVVRRTTNGFVPDARPRPIPAKFMLREVEIYAAPAK